ncbi:MAG TPA: riboflavin synthase [Stellaceae bacterium]|jgi:riboflavin synthase|nr:riboflavin synthase [Stellaceae bacterium]
MFTGIIADIGTIREIRAGGDTTFVIGTKLDLSDLALGASIACAGVCLTVIDRGDDWFAVQVSAETLARSSLKNWRVGTRINLERALRAGDELGGHIVSGHVDAMAEIVERRPDGDSERFAFRVPDAFAKAIAPKGSVALDGVSLTVNEVQGARFGVNLIPHTLAHTTFGASKVGDRVNFEIDMLARYVARLTGQTIGD